jgi:hypothetical protein
VLGDTVLGDTVLGDTVLGDTVLGGAGHRTEQGRCADSGDQDHDHPGPDRAHWAKANWPGCNDREGDDR